MARARNPNRDKAFRVYFDSGGRVKLKDIATQVGIPDSRIRKWKTEDKWDDKIKERSNSAKGALLLDKGSAPEQSNKRKPGGQPGNGNAKGHGAPIGNGNAKGNKGGAPPRNGNAIKTGEYQTIWMDYLNESEKAFYDGIDTDKDIQANVTLRNLTFRENLMMKRLFELQEGIDNIETSTVRERINQTIPMEVYDELAGEIRIKSTTVSIMRVKEITEKKKSMLGEILRIEEAVTRIQDKKAKLLQLKHKLELDQERLELERWRVEIMEKKYGGDDSEAVDGVTIVDDIPEENEDEN